MYAAKPLVAIILTEIASQKLPQLLCCSCSNFAAFLQQQQQQQQQHLQQQPGRFAACTCWHASPLMH
jgi:hypothetical protein